MDLYTYNADIVKVYDGDTVRAKLDLGFGLDFAGVEGKGHSFRLARINAPEVRGKEREQGLLSRDALQLQLENASKVYIQSVISKADKYGRYVAELFIDLGYDQVINMNDWLVENDFATYVEY